MSFTLLGILNAQAAGGAGAGIEAYDLLAAQDGSGAEIAWSNLVSAYASTYDHLEIRATLRKTTTGTTSLRGYANTDGGPYGGSYYSRYTLRGNGSTIAADTSTTATYAIFNNCVEGTNASGPTGAARILILDPFNTNKMTTFQFTTAMNYGQLSLSTGSCIYNQTTAVDRFALRIEDGSNFSDVSRLSLYGIKVA